MGLRLNIAETEVEIIDSDGDVLYTIYKDELPFTINHNLSKWILHLEEKTDITTRILYELAQYIQLNYPMNNVNWEKTFFIVEKGRYLNEMENILTTKSASIIDSVFSAIEFGMDETKKDETHSIINNIVRKRFAEFNLPQNRL